MILEPAPHPDIRRRIFECHPWPLVEGDVCVHEAGHAVVARALGMPVYDARTYTDAGFGGRAGVLSACDGIDPTPPPSPEFVADVYGKAAPLVWGGAVSPGEAALRFATMLVAGRAAELLDAGIRLPGELRMHDPDHLQARALLQATGQRHAMTWCQRTARHLLTANWPEVQAIAAELRVSGVWTNPHPWARRSSYPSTTGDFEHG